MGTNQAWHTQAQSRLAACLHTVELADPAKSSFWFQTVFPGKPNAPAAQTVQGVCPKLNPKPMPLLQRPWHSS